MARISPWWFVGPGLLLIALVLFGGFEGWYGPLLTCGADEAKVCVAWPAPASFATWLLFIALVVGLVVWQVTEWRRNPVPGVNPGEVRDRAE